MSNPAVESIAKSPPDGRLAWGDALAIAELAGRWDRLRVQVMDDGGLGFAARADMFETHVAKMARCTEPPRYPVISSSTDLL